jgi:hypothetical protein
MPIYKSTKEFFRQQKANFKLASDKDFVLRAAAIESASLIQDNVQQSGAKSDSSQIGKYNRLSKFKGAYKKALTFGDVNKLKYAKSQFSKGGRKALTYYELRKSLGLQVAYIDLTFSGDMFKNWSAFPIKGGWANGFKSKRQRKKSQDLENRFGLIFFPTIRDRAIILRYINRQATTALSK